MRRNKSSSGTAKRTAESDLSSLWDDDYERGDSDLDLDELDKMIDPAKNGKMERGPAWRLIERYKEDQWLKHQLELSEDLSFDELR